MKKLASLLIFIALAACEKGSVDQKPTVSLGYEREQRAGAEIAKFNEQLTALYAKSKADPEAMLATIDSLLINNKNEKDEYKSMIKGSIENALNYFKAELLYKAKQYNSSLNILNKSDYSCHTALAKAANYTKLKKHDLARAWVDSVNCYIEDYALGNYYETVGDEENAIKIYKELESHKEWRHYTYHPLAILRLKELQKPNPEFLDQLYFPTGDPRFEITDPQEHKERTTIFKMMEAMPECKEYGIHIYKSPLEHDIEYYWVKVSNDMTHLEPENMDKDYEAQYDFFVYPKDFTIKYYNPKTKVLLTLDEWRKILKNKKR